MSGGPSKIIQHAKKQDSASTSKGKSQIQDQKDTHKTVNGPGRESVLHIQDADLASGPDTGRGEKDPGHAS